MCRPYKNHTIATANMTCGSIYFILGLYVFFASTMASFRDALGFFFFNIAWASFTAIIQAEAGIVSKG